MKKLNLKKSIAVSAILLAGAFALSAQSYRPERAPAPAPVENGRHNFEAKNTPCQNVQTMGIVKGVDLHHELLTLENADGKAVTVHINPLTKITKLVTKKPVGSKKSGYSKGKTRAQSVPKTIVLSLNDIEKGDWVFVNGFDTRTQIIEGRHIGVKMTKRIVDTSNAK